MLGVYSMLQCKLCCEILSQVNHTTSLHVVSILTKTPLDLLYTADTSEVGGAWGTVCVCASRGEGEGAEILQCY